MPEEQKLSALEFEKIVNEAENSYNHLLSKNMGKILVGIGVFCLYMLLPKTLWLFPTETVKEKINPYQEPVMIQNEANIKAYNLKNKSDYKKLIKIKSFKNRKTYYIMPLAEYSVSARIKEKNKFFYLKWDIDNLALVDYGLTWGDMAKNEYFYKLYGHSNQTVSGRLLVFNFKDRYQNSLQYKYDYMLTHVSHTHAIPATKNVKKALNAIQKGQVVKLDGYLVDVFDSSYNRFTMSSLSLSDKNESSRGYGNGGGACEVMYVTKVQVGDKVFK